jgi:integrase/recombinase XerC
MDDMIEAYLEKLRFDESSERTVRARRDALVLLNRELRHGVGKTSQAELEHWLHNSVDHRTGKPWSQNTKSSYWSAIKGAYAFWADPRDPWINEDPTRYMTPVRGLKGVANPVEDDDLWTILDKAAQPFRRWALIAAYQGLRCCEIAGLDREHITERRLFVKRGKGGKPRTHDTDPMVWAEVEALPAGPLALDRWGRARDTANNVCRRASYHFQHELGLTGVTMHRFRHWLGVTVQERYGNVRVTQEVLGHESLSSTQIYTRATHKQQREARSMLPRPRSA